MTSAEDFTPEAPPLCDLCGEACGGDFVSIPHQRTWNVDTSRWDTTNANACDDCYFVCRNCSQPTINDERYVSEINGHPYCEDCYYETHFTCERCSSTHYMRHACTNNWRDGMYCQDCNDEIENENDDYDSDYDDYDSHRSAWIRSYSVKVSGVFRKWNEELGQATISMRPRREEPYLGWELETNMRSGSDWTLRERGAEALANAAPSDYLIMKEDGSISGFEIVTQPCDYRTHLEIFPWQMLRTLANDFGMTSWRGGGAGLHVHISKSSFSKLHLGAFLQFHDKNTRELIKLAGRESSYSKFGRTINDWGSQYKQDRVKQALGHEVNGDRYVAVNLQNDHTVELRYFRGSLKPETVKGVLEFTHSLWLYTKKTKFTSLDCHKNILWDAYRGWLFDQPEFTLAQSLVTTRGL